MKILVCEKEEVLLTALEFRLQRKGFTVELAKNGAQALEKLKQNNYDIAIIGTEVEEVSGLEVIRQLRQEMRTDMPVIAIAPLEAEEEILQAFELGATDFVTKPFKPVELVLRVRRILGDGEASSLGE